MMIVAVIPSSLMECILTHSFVGFHLTDTYGGRVVGSSPLFPVPSLRSSAPADDECMYVSSVIRSDM